MRHDFGLLESGHQVTAQKLVDLSVKGRALIAKCPVCGGQLYVTISKVTRPYFRHGIGDAGTCDHYTIRTGGTLR